MTTHMIRRARPEEATALSVLAETSKRHWGYDDAFIAEIDETAIGFYLLAQTSLERLFISPEFFGHGVGRALMAHLQTQAREQGLTRIEIISDPNAADFYRRTGAIEAGLSNSQFVSGRQLPVFVLEISAG